MPTPLIDSPDVGRFRDRSDAGVQLAWALRAYRGRRPLVLGIPRGGMVPAGIVSRELGGDLDVALVRKLRAPGRPDVSIGSIAENGFIFLNEGWEERIENSYLKSEAADALSHLREQRRLYGGGRPPPGPAGRIVIVVDDGIATGATISAALQGLRSSNALQVVAATAVSPRDSIDALRRAADKVVVIAVTEPFYAVSPFFVEFSEVTDDEVVDLLRKPPRPARQDRVG